MTILLEKALARVVQLPEEELDTIATVILTELDDEQRWNAAFSASLDKLSKMAAKVRQDIKAGRMREMGFAGLV
jgi:hypothetical protein